MSRQRGTVGHQGRWIHAAFAAAIVLLCSCDRLWPFAPMSPQDGATDQRPIDQQPADQRPIDQQPADQQPPDHQDGGPPCRSIRFATPVKLPRINETYDSEWMPAISADGLSLYFASFRNGNSDIWLAERASLTDDFSTPVELSQVNSSGHDSLPAISADELTLLFVSVGSVLTARRASNDEPFSATTEVNLEGDKGCSLFLEGADRYAVYCASSRSGNSDIYVSTWTPSSGQVTSPQSLVAVNTRSHEICPRISFDGLELYFSSNRADGGARGQQDIWVAMRPDTTADFEPPQRLEGGWQTEWDEVGASLCGDGTTLYLNLDADIEGAGPLADVYTAQRVCP